MNTEPRTAPRRSVPLHAVPAGGAEAGCGCGCPLPSVCGEDTPSTTLNTTLRQTVSRRRRLEAGEDLFLSGQPRRAVYVVRNGVLKSYEIDETGREQVVGFHWPGDVIGLDRLECRTHRGFAAALEPAAVCCIPVEAIHARLAENPRLWPDVLAAASGRIARSREMHRVLGQLSSTRRLLWFLLHAALPRAPDSEQLRLHLPMSRQDIASYLGMTLETVSRAFGALRRDGLIRVECRDITLIQPEGLEELVRPGRQRAA